MPDISQIQSATDTKTAANENTSGQINPTVKTQTSYAAMPKENLVPTVPSVQNNTALNSKPTEQTSGSGTYGTLWPSLEDAAVSANFMSLRSSAVPMINVHTSKEQILKPESTFRETMSLRGSKASVNSTQRHGKLCMWIVVQKLEDPVGAFFICK